MALTEIPIELSSTPGIVDNSNATAITIDASENVGIGTGSPAGLLNLHSGSGDSNLFITTGNTAASTNIFFGDTDNSSIGRIVYDHGGNYMNFRTNGSDAMRIDSSGNLGIGTSSPSAPLDVRSSAASGIVAELHNNVGYGIDIGTSTADAYISSGYQQNFIFKTNAGSGQVERMRIDSSGRLGLGITPSATTAFTVFQNRYLSLYGFDAAQSHIVTNTYYPVDNGVYKRQAFGYAQKLTMNNGSYIFNTAASGAADSAITFTPAMTLDASGNLLVGTTNSSGSVSEGIKLKAGGNANSVSIVSNRSTSADEGFTMWSTYANTWRFYVGWGGTIHATSNTIAAISDQRFKENIRDLDDGLSKVMELKPRKFDWKEGKGADIKDDRGFIAQEFEEVFPDLVGIWKDEAPEGEEPYKAVSADLIPTLVKAIQEQQATIEALTARIAALES